MVFMRLIVKNQDETHAKGIAELREQYNKSLKYIDELEMRIKALETLQLSDKGNFLVQSASSSGPDECCTVPSASCAEIGQLSFHLTGSAEELVVTETSSSPTEEEVTSPPGPIECALPQRSRYIKSILHRPMGLLSCIFFFASLIFFLKGTIPFMVWWWKSPMRRQARELGVGFWQTCMDQLVVYLLTPP
eukprot:Blabericola_migrator_1__7208@NODE_365_length_9399_cov_81_035255_g292_i0_p6_GENE_NODE_365_length_9399_cov_81_035255_g292_i0NODE_365_length_9399_cov_81_035255_g292_i0_p6_ORF_typecomplete_len191_score15_81TelA/PF05816_11/0_13Cast/PF10174_9/0_2_NODE_365_length_9399_cov_81_035255_g292_i06851257